MQLVTWQSAWITELLHCHVRECVVQGTDTVLGLLHFLTHLTNQVLEDNGLQHDVPLQILAGLAFRKHTGQVSVCG